MGTEDELGSLDGPGALWPPHSDAAGWVEPGRHVAGHVLAPHAGDCGIDAWGPDRASCLSEALRGLVEVFAVVPDPVSTGMVPLSTATGSAEDELVSLLEEVIYTLDVFSVVPVRFHLAETEDGHVAGDMEVVPVDQVAVVGPVPKSVSCHELSMASGVSGWQCHVLVDM
jgi:SHS2 domain-containing protein